MVDAAATRPREPGDERLTAAVGIAVIGAGQWGPNLIRNFHDAENSRVVWVVDSDPSRLEQVRARFPEARLGRKAGPALADPEVTAVVVATPTSTHYEIVKAALDQGKHVLVEKPLATAVAEAEELCCMAEHRSLVLLVGHVFLFNTGVRRVARLIDDGDLGRIYYVSMVRTNLGPIRTEVSAAWDLASHDIAIANFWLGGKPTSVSALGGRWINPGFEDAVFATLRYPGAVLVSLHASWLNPRKARDITIVGERRMATLDDMSLSEPLRVFDKSVSDERSNVGFVDTFASFRASVHEGDITIPRVPLSEPLRAECEHFLECIVDGTTPLSGGPEGLAVVRVLEALDRSLQRQGHEEQVR